VGFLEGVSESEPSEPLLEPLLTALG